MPVFNWSRQQNPQDALPATWHLGSPVEIAVHPLLERSLLASNSAPPAPIRGAGILDTGCTCTSIDFEVATQLGLRATGQATMMTANGVRKTETFAFRISLAPGLVFPCVRGLGCDPRAQGIQALIGMDLLVRGAFVVNGPAGLITFAQ